MIETQTIPTLKDVPSVGEPVVAQQRQVSASDASFAPTPRDYSTESGDRYGAWV